MQVDAEVNEAYKVGAYLHEDKLVFMSETINAVVLDCACSKTIAGHEGKEMHLASLLESVRKEVRFIPGGTTFKFGVEDKIQFDEGMEIPCIITGQKVT